MNRYTTPLLLAALTLLAGCQGMPSLSPTTVDLTPPPTSVPLSTSTSASEAASPTPTPTASTTPVPTNSPTSTRTARPTPRNTPTPQPSTSTPSPTAVVTQPTRVVTPPEAITLPSGFGTSVFADGLRGPRMMALGPDGAIYVAERGRDRIVRLPDRNGDGIADAVEVVSPRLNAPSSIAFFQDGSLYVGETTRILRLSEPDPDGVWARVETVIDGLPSGGGHSTRTVLFSPDWQWLYVSVGSSCNVCIEQDPRRAAILRYAPHGDDETVFATGLRNAVGITFRPGTDELWATNNGRDWLGDDQPPETVYLVHQGDDAGWPRCHAGRIVDPDFGEPGACDGVAKPEVEMQAHSAPLGLTFYTGQQFPPEYQGDMFIAFHGSWNRSVPTGYKVVRVPMEGGTPGMVADFVIGWLRADGSQWGRPVDVLTGADGSLYVSDDGEGRIYRIFYSGP
jgi:glucose/arabinose dehydrogenase